MIASRAPRADVLQKTRERQDVRRVVRPIDVQVLDGQDGARGRWRHGALRWGSAEHRARGAEGKSPDAGKAARLARVTRLLRPALFLDRDGVLNEDRGYVHRWEDFCWIPGAREAVAAFNARDWWVFVVTNQSGVGRGYYPEADVLALHARMEADLAAALETKAFGAVVVASEAAHHSAQL